MNYREYQTTRDSVWRLLRDCGITMLPIRITDVCRDMGVKVYRADDLETAGESMVLYGKPCIFVSLSGLDGRDRFTIAHELGHLLLGHVGNWKRVRRGGAKENAFEQTANAFAARLLAPACVLWGCDVQSAEEIEALCEISRQAAEYRMKRMRKLYKRNRFLISPLEREVYEQFEPFMKAYRAKKESGALDEVRHFRLK